MELLQGLTPDRSPSWYDAIANTAGVAAAAAIVFVFRLVLNRLAPR